MKKTMTLLAIAVLVCVASVFAFTACNLDDLKIEGEGSWDIDADTKEDCMEQLNGLFEDVLKNANIVVTTKVDGETTQVENVLGTKSCYETPGEEGSKTYVFIQNGTYFVANEGNHSYVTGKDKYDLNYCLFLMPIKFVDALDANAGTFACHVHVNDKDTIISGQTVTESEGTLAFTYTSSEGTVTINATLKNELVQTLTFTVGDSKPVTYTFTYNSASVTTPDLSTYTEEISATGDNDVNDNADVDEE